MRRLPLVAAMTASFCAQMMSSNALKAAYKPNANVTRESIPDTYKWHLKDIFKSDSAWKTELKEAQAKIKGLVRHKNSMKTSHGLKKCLDDYFSLKLLVQRISAYSFLKMVEDETCEKYQKMYQLGQGLEKQFNIGTAFIRDFVVRFDKSDMQKLISTKEMQKYKDYIKEARRRKKHFLSPESEKILAMLGDNLFTPAGVESDVERIFRSTMRDMILPKIKDEKGKVVQLTLANYARYRASKNRRVRKSTVKALFDTLVKYQDIFAATLAGEVKLDVVFAEARKYPRTINAYLDVDNIEPSVVDNLISTIHKNIKYLRRYVVLRKRILKLDKVHIYDLYTPLVKSIDVGIPYDESIQDIVNALQPLGDDYINVLSNALQPNSGWNDIYPNKGKESGAFSDFIWGIHPFNKLNYMDTIDDVFTTAHEMGHAMHSYLNALAQPYFMSGYSTFTAEIASTLNETLLMKYLLKKSETDSNMKMYLLGKQIENIRTTIYRQVLFAEFEKKIHEFAEARQPLTAELFNKTYADLVKFYYGKDFVVDSHDGMEWAYIPHFYYKYYVYTYATGLSSGISLAQSILSGGKVARNKYLNMLRQPSTSAPLAILKEAGVDLTKPDAINDACRLMGKSIDQIERILKQRGI